MKHMLFLNGCCLQDDSWVIMLEGWCRIKLQAPPKNALQAFTFLNVKQVGPSKNARSAIMRLCELGKLSEPLSYSVDLHASADRHA